ncbi:MAG: hypothetical protein JSR44_09755 [Spirochaetes bacterium]|nr:hypothetical protein [Spirochaetota bacterium]
MRNRIRIILLGVIVITSACNNYDLESKLENPASLGQGTGALSIVSTNITPVVNNGGSFTAVVTFNRAVNVPPGSITIDNSAVISGISSPDNITWSFTIGNLFNSTVYTVTFTPQITASDGTTLTPTVVQFTSNVS